MSEDEAQAEIDAFAPGVLAKLKHYAALLVAENDEQNLIAESTVTTLWVRHLLDSVQLARFARAEDRRWLDIGSGAGLPGIVLAILGRWDVTLVEPRRRRAEFLDRAAKTLGLERVTIVAADIRTLSSRADVISARAVADVDTILRYSRGCATPATRYILPKGRSAWHDVEAARGSWHGVFHVEQSLTDPHAGIVIADQVRSR